MDPKINVRNYNREAWDKQVEIGENPWTKPVNPEVIENARKGFFQVLLTETKPVPLDWFPPFKDLKILALASGGGQQGPVFAALGASVTVFDNSPRQLGRDREVAEREGLTKLSTVEGDARDLSIFPDQSFDLIFHPVSNVFIPEIVPIWREAFRVLRHGGTLLSGFMNPAYYIFDFDQAENGILEVKYKLPYADIDHQEIYQRQVDHHWPLEYSHTLTDQLAGQLDAGFQIIGLYEDVMKNMLISEYFPVYIATRALKP